MVSDDIFDHRSPHMPRHMLEEYKKIILETQGRVLEDGDAELEAMDLVRGMHFLLELEMKDLRNKRLHRILTNWQPKVELRSVDERFFG